MSRPLTARTATRRYVGLTALRWLPVGLSTPVTVLLASARGLSPADIGVVLAVYSVVTLLLELPTGGLADALGHRLVLALAGLVTTAGLLLLVVADSTAAFALAWALQGVGRALDSGPLEAWYVEAVRAADPDADVTRGLSRAGAADGAGLCLGAVLGGLLPLLAGDGSSEVLALPLLVAAALALVSVVAVAALVVPVGAPRSSGAAALRAGLPEVPVVVRATVGLVARDRVLRRLLGISLLVGAVLTTLELLGPLHVAELTGSRTEGAAVFGVVMAVSYAAAGLGALLAPAVQRLARGSVAAATTGLAVLGALAVAAVTVAGPLALGGLFAVFHVANAAAWPLWKQLLHGQVTGGQRATTLSASSLALMVGALGGSLLVPRLVEAVGPPAGFRAAAVALLLVALVSLRLRPRHSGPQTPGTPAATGVAAGHG
ncbi:Major Facilitator Superfamily protein [Geodermatophilus obscurus]|uniref:Major Facilitator Superfamily protein n=1 Tax=Geodermatophilus obscurus TaxID=1861 RepID=A0A1M7RT71_9ACTN|nr:MFS transporter [Geodermatophilus obscurus]SHN49513.1 Major Facilitator Superfamily protein [Geodermatophilus obscurus]